MCYLYDFVVLICVYSKTPKNSTPCKQENLVKVFSCKGYALPRYIPTKPLCNINPAQLSSSGCNKEPVLVPLQSVLKPTLVPLQSVLKPILVPLQSVLKPTLVPLQSVLKPTLVPLQSVLKPTLVPLQSVLKPTLQY